MQKSQDLYLPSEKLRYALIGRYFNSRQSDRSTSSEEEFSDPKDKLRYPYGKKFIKNRSSSKSRHHKTSQDDSKDVKIYDSNWQESNDSSYDTDLEKEFDILDVKYTSQAIYKRECDRLEIRPLGEIYRGLETESIEAAYLTMDHVDMRAFCVALMDNCRVRFLDISGNNIGDIGARFMAQVFNCNKYIEVLNISGNNISHAGFSPLCSAILTNLYFCEFKIANNKLKDIDGKDICNLMIENAALTLLDLSDNQIGLVGSGYIAKGLDNNDTIRILDLSRNCIGPKAVKLFKSIVANNNLTELGLSFNGISNVGAKILGNFLGKDCELRILDISYNRINAEGAKFIAKGLKNNSVLKKLDISNNPIMNTGAHMIFNALESNKLTTVKHISMQGTWVNKDFMEIWGRLYKSINIVLDVGGLLKDFMPGESRLKDEDTKMELVAEEVVSYMNIVIKLLPMAKLAHRIRKNFPDNKNAIEDFGVKPDIEGLVRPAMSLTHEGFKQLIAPFNLSPLNEIDIYRIFSQKYNSTIMDFKNFKNELKRMDSFLRDIYAQIGELSFSPPSELNGELQILRFGAESQQNKLIKLGAVTKAVLRGRKTKFSNKKLKPKKKETKPNSIDQAKTKKIITGIKKIAQDSKDGSNSASKNKLPKIKKRKTKKKNNNNNNNIDNNVGNTNNNHKAGLIAFLNRSNLKKYKSHHNLSLIGQRMILPPIDK